MSARISARARDDLWSIIEQGFEEPDLTQEAE